jgi:S1-C subfamily serine protease
MHARLVFLSGSKSGSSFDLAEEDATVGRAPDRTVTFSPDDVVVSTEHATLLYRNGRWFIRDEGSRNGTFVNSEQVKERELRDGDVIQFGAGGPAARFVTGSGAGVGVMPTMDIHVARKTGADLSAAGHRGGISEPMSTRELVVVSYAHLATQVRRRTYLGILLIVGILASIAALAFAQRQNKVRLERGLQELAVVAASSKAIEQDLAGLQARYAALRDAVAQGQAGKAGLISLEGVANYARGVVLIAYSYGYTQRNGGALLRYETGPQGQILTTPGGDGHAAAAVGFGASGPPVVSSGVATGFIVDSTGFVVTNRWVAEPWVVGEELKLLKARGLDLTPRMVDLRAYLPPGDRSFPLFVQSVSNAADVSVMRLVGATSVGAPRLPLADDSVKVQPGEGVLAIGYPQDARNLLFRMDSVARQDLLRQYTGDSRKLVEELARLRLIEPIVTEGKVQAVTDAEIVNTSGVTVGGTGGPLIDARRRVVGVQGGLPSSEAQPAAARPAVPITYVWAILPSFVKRALGHKP